MGSEIVETVRGKHRRVEVRKQSGVIADIKYTLFDPDKSSTVSGTFSRLDDAFEAAKKYVNA